jgi:hypothetical protein
MRLLPKGTYHEVTAERDAQFRPAHSTKASHGFAGRTVRGMTHDVSRRVTTHDVT